MVSDEEVMATVSTMAGELRKTVKTATNKFLLMVPRSQALQEEALGSFDLGMGCSRLSLFNDIKIFAEGCIVFSD